MARLVIGFAYLMVFLSGTTGLIYQVVWQKYLSIYLGSHASATALVLTAFFLYLAVGYFVLGKYSHRLIKNKLILYGSLELAIGAYALVSPDYFNWLQTYFLSQPWAAGFGTHFIFSSLFLAVPTFLMGGTIPVLTEGLSTQFDRSHRVHAYVYGLNTAGAFFGTLLAGFFLIEKFGLPLTLTVAGIANITIFLMCYVAAKTSSFSFSGPPTFASPTVMPARERWTLYAISFFAGFYVFSLETLIIRMAGISTFSSPYIYSIIVACFIVAIAIGSFWAAKFDSWGRANYMAIMQTALLLACAALYFSVPEWPGYFGRLRSLIFPSLANLPSLWALITLSFIFILIIPVGLMGMNLPLLFGYLRQRNEHLSVIVGRLYGANSLGSVLGASLGGYYFYMFLDGDQVFKWNLALILINLALILSLTRGLRFRKTLAVALALAAFAATLVVPWRPEKFSPSRFLSVLLNPDDKSFSQAEKRLRRAKAEIVFSKFDPNTYVTVERQPLEITDKLTGMNHVLSLNVNAKPDAVHPGDSLVRVALPLIATSIAEKVDKVFIVGFGAGLSTAVVTNLSENQTVEVAEISEAVVEGAEFFNDVNLDLRSRKHKYKVTVGDGYQVLMAKKDKYDLILSEPSNPWVVGVDKLFTYEFLKNIAEHLNEKGVFAQWFPVGTVSEEMFLEILRTLTSVFPHVTVWNPGGATVSILSSLSPQSVTKERLERRFGDNKAFFKTIMVRDPMSILGRQIYPPWTVAGLASRTAKIQTLENPVLTYTSGRQFLTGTVTRTDNLLRYLLLKPVPEGEPGTQFLYEPFLGTLSDQFYTDTIGFLKDVGSLNPAALVRFEFEREQFRPRPRPPAKPQAHEWAGYVLGKTPLPKTADKMDPIDRARHALSAYINTKLAHLSPRMNRVLEHVDSECKDDKCLNLQIQILREFLPPKERPKAARAPKDDSEKERLRKAFAEFKQDSMSSLSR
jgi:predicted membrane-bound spermidine synthase